MIDGLQWLRNCKMKCLVKWVLIDEGSQLINQWLVQWVVDQAGLYVFQLNKVVDKMTVIIDMANAGTKQLWRPGTIQLTS